MEEKLSFSFRKRQITGCTKISHCEEKPPLLLLVFISRELLGLVFNYVATIIVIDAKKRERYCSLLSQKTFSHFYKEQSILRSEPLVGLGMCWSDLLGTVLLRGGEIGAKESAGRLLSYSPSPTSSSFPPHLCWI